MKKERSITRGMWIATLASLLAVCALIAVIHAYNGSGGRYDRYYLAKDYADLPALLDKLSLKPQQLFYWCCDCIVFFARKCGISYEEANLYLFVVIQPYLILLFATGFVVQTRRLSRRG